MTSKTWKATERDKQLYEKSRAAFNVYATLDGDPRYVGLTELACLQIELMRWERRNFGLQPDTFYVLGITEELGEFEEARVCDDVNIDTEALVQDAVSDILVFTSNMCSSLRLDFDTLANSLHMHDNHYTMLGWSLNRLPIAVGRLAHVTLKTAQKIRGFDDVELARFCTSQALARIIAGCINIGQVGTFDVRGQFTETATKVMQREWAKDRETAGGHA